MKNNIRILCVGNSFSVGATRYLHRISEKYDTEIDVYNLFIGGCSLERHWNNAVGDIHDYRIFHNGVWEVNNASIREYESFLPWDYITFQQASYFSHEENTYAPFLGNLAAYFRKSNPNAEYLIHQTQPVTNVRCVKSFGISGSEEMYERLVKNYDNAAKTVGAVGILPTGYAIHTALTEYGVFENLVFSDYTGHLGLRYGEYCAALCWYGALTGEDVLNDTFKPEGADEELTAVMRKCASAAAKKYCFAK